jgi:hypothetical protein
MSPAGCPQVGRVDDHFAGRLSVAREKGMREHLVACDPCRDRYTRHLRLEALDPRALGFAERMRRGLGLARPAFSSRLVGMAGFGAALALGAILLLPRLSSVPLGDSGLRARGTGSAAPPLVLALDDGTEISGFRTSGPGAPAPATQRWSAESELAFSYRNGGGWSRLMIFARDQGGRVFWFHPQWTDPSSNPQGVDLARGPGRHELPAAVAHQFSAGKLALCALVSQAAVSVRDVETALAAGRPASAALAGTPGAAVCKDVQVEVGP